MSRARATWTKRFEREFGSGSDLWDIDIQKIQDRHSRSAPTIAQVQGNVPAQVNFEVERIVGYDETDRKYRTRWVGFGEDDDTWQTLSTFPGGLQHDAIRDWWFRMSLGPGKIHTCKPDCLCRK